MPRLNTPQEDDEGGGAGFAKAVILGLMLGGVVLVLGAYTAFVTIDGKDAVIAGIGRIPVWSQHRNDISLSGIYLQVLFFLGGVILVVMDRLMRGDD